jgi:hypothetical protein
MISAKRIVNLFHQTGGGDEFTKTATEFAYERLVALGAILETRNL